MAFRSDNPRAPSTGLGSQTWNIACLHGFRRLHETKCCPHLAPLLQGVAAFRSWYTRPKLRLGFENHIVDSTPVRLVCRDEMRPNIGHRSHSSLGIDSNNPATRYPRRGDTTADGSKEWWVGSVFFHVARCVACAYALLGGKGRMVPAAFLLAIPGVRGEVWARALKHKAGRWKGNLVFDRLRRRRTTTNGQPSLSWGRCRKRDKYLASLPVGHPRFPYPPYSNRLHLSRLLSYEAIAVPLYSCIPLLSLRDILYYLSRQTSQSYPPIAARSNTSY